jgi:hypothetical protein
MAQSEVRIYLANRHEAIQTFHNITGKTAK